MATRKHLDKIPDDLEYFQHQVDAAREMMVRAGLILGDDMGLGKSLTALTVAAIAFQLGELKRFLIVCPATLKPNWEEEIANHTLFDFTTVPSGMSATKRAEVIGGLQTDCLIVNYEQVITHYKLLNVMDFGMAIYDEAHYLKNPKAKRTKACFHLAIVRNFLLTGSPMLNQVNDLWALLHRVDPVEWANYWKFVNRYAVFGGYMDRQIVGVKNEKELRERLAKYMIRRTKADCLDLPEKLTNKVYVDLLEEQQVVYDQARDELKIDIPGDPTPMEIENALTKFLRLKQICGTTAAIEGMDDYSAKLDRAVELVLEIIAGGEPVVIFTQFRSVLSCMAQRLTLIPVPSWQIHGGLKPPERMAQLNEWKAATKAGNHGAMLCMFQVGGVGLNMAEASNVILVDKLFAPLLNEQATDRLHRIGQTRVVQVIEIIARKTIESRIESILTQKRNIFGAIVNADNSDWKKRLIRAVLDEEEEDT